MYGFIDKQLRIDLVFENKGYLHLDTILGDLPVFIDDDFLILDPGTPDMGKSFLGARIPTLMASSKLLVEEALISVTRATDIFELLSIG